MNWRGTGRALLHLYVAAVGLAGVVTLAWLAAPHVLATPKVATLWFAVGGFGLLVGSLVVLALASRS